jgi:hypothetical protein
LHNGQTIRFKQQCKGMTTAQDSARAGRVVTVGTAPPGPRPPNVL